MILKGQSMSSASADEISLATPLFDNLFEDRCFEDFAKFCQHWTVYSLKFQAPGMELTNHSLEVELTQSRPQRGCFLDIFPKFYEKQFLRITLDKMLWYLLLISKFAIVL